jgi:D-alanyl-D-alanine carboxypeptidase/D-alanyl-D-alanine-endopeptidase (penicillin-binding protein 4)
MLVLAAPVLAAADPSAGRLRKAIEPIVSGGELATAFWGIEVRSLESGRTLYALNSGKAFRPASTLKLVTTAAALDAYGPDARIRTTLETAGRLDSLGRILGDVFLVGRGDPNLSARFSPGRPTAAFEAMSEALVAAGVKRIEGRVIGHEGAFVGDRRGSSWTWEDLAWLRAAGERTGRPVGQITVVAHNLHTYERPAASNADESKEIIEQWLCRVTDGYHTGRGTPHKLLKRDDYRAHVERIWARWRSAG